jgi:hypothetical protein
MYLKVFELFDPFVDKRILNCPLKKGKYVVLRARPKDFLENVDITGKLPGYIPLKGKYVFYYKTFTTVQNKKVEIFKGLEVFEFI